SFPMGLPPLIARVLGRAPLQLQSGANPVVAVALAGVAPVGDRHGVGLVARAPRHRGIDPASRGVQRRPAAASVAGAAGRAGHGDVSPPRPLEIAGWPRARAPACATGTSTRLALTSSPA